MSLDRVPELGTKPVSLSVKLPKIKNHTDDTLGDGLRDLYAKGAFTDVTLLCAERRFEAHRVVLAAQSEVLREGLKSGEAATPGQKQEVRLAEVANPEAVQFMLDYLYQLESAVWAEYNPQTQEINKDVLRLAQTFRIPGLTERATHFLAKDLTTANVVERLTICEDFGLLELRERILEQLTYNKNALAEVASSPQICAHPKLMLAMLQLAAAVPSALVEEKEEQQPKKKKIATKGR